MRFERFSGKLLTGLSEWRVYSRYPPLFCFKFVSIYYMDIPLDGLWLLIPMTALQPVFYGSVTGMVASAVWDCCCKWIRYKA